MSDDAQLRAGITRRGLVRAGAWSVPVIAAAAALPSATASALGQWVLQNVIVDLRQAPFPGPGGEPYLLSVTGDLLRADGQPVSETGVAFLRTDTGIEWTWNFVPWPSAPYPLSTGKWVDTLDATTVTITIDGELFGAYPIQTTGPI